jgi:ribosomal protein S18 acetylase RimI-like enzyme
MEDLSKTKKKKLKIFSDAFPEIGGIKQKPYVHSNVHKLLLNHQINKNNIKYRKINETDLEEIKNLHNEWFPIKYDESFFKVILNKTNKNYITLTAVYEIDNKEYIIGLLLGETKTEEQYNNQVSEEFRKFHFFTKTYRYIYIMTLGVIDECRGLKIATQLIEKIVYEYSPEVIFLHVVDYNKTAINFYLNNKFYEASVIRNYYHIMDNVYDTKVLVRRIDQENALKKLIKYILCKFK